MIVTILISAFFVIVAFFAGRTYQDQKDIRQMIEDGQRRSKALMEPQYRKVISEVTVQNNDDRKTHTFKCDNFFGLALMCNQGNIEISTMTNLRYTSYDTTAYLTNHSVIKVVRKVYIRNDGVWIPVKIESDKS